MHAPIEHTNRTGGRLKGLEASRGLAALAVLVSHASAILAEPRFYDNPGFAGLFVKFGAGVDFFFVLSGFIVAWVHWNDIGVPARLGRYAKRRFIRIYPPYWGILLPLSLAYALFPDAGTPSQHSPVNFLFSLTLLPYPEHPILGVAWTLVFEMAFYAVFASFIWFGRSALLVLPLWAGAVLIANMGFAPLQFPVSFILDVHILEFIFGVALAAALQNHRLPLPRACALLGGALFVGQMLWHHPVLDDPLVGRLGFGLAATLAIAGIVEWERGAGITVPFVLYKLGSASYALYLIHAVAISVATQIMLRLFGNTLSLPVAFALVAAAAVAAGLIYHEIFEKPVSRWLGKYR